MDHLLETATKNVSDIVRLAIRHTSDKSALIVTDVRSPLSRLMTQAYRAALPGAIYIDFDTVTQDEVKAAINALSPGDLVVLAQSQDFRLNEFRLRIELFQRGLATIEHAHLDRETSDEEMTIFVEAMAYDPNYYRPLGLALKEKIDAAQTIEVRCAGTTLTYSGPMEPTKLNVGDYAGMKNVGGTFPIGEVFSEPQDITTVNGEAMIFGFAGPDHLMQIHEPFKIVIEKGMVVRHDGPAIFQQVLERISASESVMVREFGVGLNRAMSKTRVIPDVTSFERQKGLHLSLGEKHSVYKKAGLIAKKTHFHVDIFVDVETILVNSEPIYANNDVRVTTS